MRRLPCRRALLLLAVAAVAAALPGGAPAARDGRPHIAIVALVDHPAIDAMRRGISDSLRETPLPPDNRLRLSYETADADPERVEAIARSLVDSDVDLVIALTEPMARAVAAQPLRIPVVVSGIPLAAADAIAVDRQARLLTGIAIGDVHRVHMDLVSEVQPGARTVLFPYRNDNSAPPAMIRALTAAARTHPFTVVPYAVPAGADPAAVLPRSLDRSTTVVYLAATAVGAHADALVGEANRRGLPVIADSRGLVVRGATATIVHDDYAIGRQTGSIAAAILRDPTRARQPIRRAEARFLVVNGEAMNDRRLNLPARLADRADEVIAWAQAGGPNPVTKPAPPAAVREPAETAPARGSP